MTRIDIFETEGRYCLSAIIKEDVPDALFAERDLQGGGYTWEAILRSLMAIHALKCSALFKSARKQIIFSPMLNPESRCKGRRNFSKLPQRIPICCCRQSNTLATTSSDPNSVMRFVG